MSDIDPSQAVAYLGPQGTYSHRALLKYFGAEQVSVPVPSIEEVFLSIENDDCDYGVVPLENSSEGSVSATLDCLNQSPISICGEILLRIQHVLMVQPQTNEAGIRRIVSHQQSLGQCRNWLEKHYPGIETVAVSSNAEAAKMASLETGVAAIASQTAAEIYQLNVLAEDIEDTHDNSTRFLIVSKKNLAQSSGHDKTSLIITTRNEPGALFNVLEPLQRFDVNMSRLESRPSRKEAWSYSFYIDIDGHQRDKNIAAAIDALKQPDLECRILGSYPKSGTVHLVQDAIRVDEVLLNKKIVVIGLGLIGGSLARSLSDKGLGSQIWAVGRNLESLQQAYDSGVIAGFSTELEEVCSDADIVVIAVPGLSVGAIMQGLAGIVKQSCVITDVASVKQSTVDAALSAFGEIPENLVPGHPIAGSEKSGFQASRSDLFAERRVILTPLPETNADALKLVSTLWREVGAEVLQMSVEKHDEVLAATSHLPHLLAYALVDTLSKQGTSEEIFRYAAGGFRDFTRIAASDPHMWKDIFLSNALPILAILEELETDINVFKQALNQGDSDYLMQVLTRSKQSRDKFPNK